MRARGAEAAPGNNEPAGGTEAARWRGGGSAREGRRAREERRRRAGGAEAARGRGGGGAREGDAHGRRPEGRRRRAGGRRAREAAGGAEAARRRAGGGAREGGARGKGRAGGTARAGQREKTMAFIVNMAKLICPPREEPGGATFFWLHLHRQSQKRLHEVLHAWSRFWKTRLVQLHLKPVVEHFLEPYQRGPKSPTRPVQ
jgi:hypothetical protein